MEKEVWREAKSFTKYEVSSLGRIRNKEDGKIRNLASEVVSLDGRSVRVCRLVGESFIPNPYRQQYVVHLDNNPTNNRKNNLIWGDKTYLSEWRESNFLKSNKLGRQHVIQMELSGKKIRLFNTINDILEYYKWGRSIARNIQRCLNGQKFQIQGYRWSFFYSKNKKCSYCGRTNAPRYTREGLCNACHDRLRRNGFLQPKEKIVWKEHPGLRHTYYNMKERCCNPQNRAYSDYGGRGIKICKRWLGKDGVKNFVLDMGNKPNRDYSLDRIDVDGDYCPENCRWASKWEQAANQRRNCDKEQVGVFYDKRDKVYIPTLVVDKKQMIQGRSKNIKNATVVRRLAEKELGVQI